MKSMQIRQKFFDFFIKKKHTLIPSSSLIPAEDPTLLFTNAGMNQFKDVFLGKEQRSYTRAVSIQKCIRAGGKHNDLENVGFTKRHLTFFEMMGNFSFGDYFKEDAIKFAWQFLTEELHFDPSLLYASVFEKDEEAYTIWRTVIGLSKKQIVQLGAADNFWQMGETGPCGPCSEIYSDRGSTYGCGLSTCAPGCSCDRFLEIWNLVFMQFNRQENSIDIPLSHKGVDTGMGLERLCTVIQNTDSVFDTDLFLPLIQRIEKLTSRVYQTADPLTKAAFRVIADHIRSSCFAIADGCTPSAEGRGYVLRKIIRRAALFSQKLSTHSFFPDVAPALIEQMHDVYPELKIQEKLIITLLKNETEKFEHNLINGQTILSKYMQTASDNIITGQQAFKLYDTYGFPLEITKVIAFENNFSVDSEGFEKEMEQQRSLSGKKIKIETMQLDPSLETEFTGYDEFETTTTISGLLVGTNPVEVVSANETCWIITPKSPFYIEGGGQISDQGWVIIQHVQIPVHALKRINKAFALEITSPVPLKIGDSITLVVNKISRITTLKNHTATHLLQSALMNLLGKEIKQAGSLVTPDYLRFDFTYHENLSTQQIHEIEKRVNETIMDNIPLVISHMSYKQALDRGVIAFFGEKYNQEKVRVVEIPGISAELCGGTHVKATGDIGSFKITEVTSLSAATRRIVALTGSRALELFQKDFDIVKTIAQEYKIKPEGVVVTILKQKESLKQALHELKKLKKEFLKTHYATWLSQMEIIHTIPFVYLFIPDVEPLLLREIAHDLSQQKPGLYFLVSSFEGRNNFVSTLSSELISRINLTTLISYLKSLGLSGGLSGNSIQGSFTQDIPELYENIKEWIKHNVKK